MGSAKACHACGTAWDGSPGAQPGRGETCAKCGADLHCCLNCKLYDSSYNHECRSSTTEYVKDKEKLNFCDEFEFKPKGQAGGGGQSSKGDMDQKWNDLFK